MYIVVIGLGEVGRHLLARLEQESHDVVAVDSDPDHVEYAQEHFDVAAMVGYGAAQEVLESAGVGKADLVVAVTDRDEVNLIAALAAKNLGAKRVIARAQGNDWVRWTGGVRNQLLGVDVVINPRIVVAQELAKIARSRGAAEIVGLADDRITLEQVELTDDYPHTDKKLAELDMPRGVLVAAVVRDDELFVPIGSDTLRPHDRIYLIGRPRAVRLAEELFSSRREARAVAIVGGGVIGRALASALVEQGAEVLILERDLERAEAISAALPDVTVIHGEGTDLTLLEEEEIGRYDLLAAVTGQDEVNLMVGLLGRRVGVARTACVVNRAEYIEIYRQLGIDAVLSPRIIASDHILRFARSTKLQSLTQLENGKAEVLELRARKGSRAIGTPLYQLGMPRGSLVAAIVHGGRITIGRGDSEIAAGDTVILLTTAKTRAAVEDIFRPEDQ